jgi:hypothetical protein
MPSKTIDPGSKSGARTVLPYPTAINQGRQLARDARAKCGNLES